MNIESVIRKTIVIVNGVEYVVDETDFTETAKHYNSIAKCTLKTDKDVIDYVCMD